MTGFPWGSRKGKIKGTGAQEIARSIIDIIESGDALPGTKLPSTRNTAQILGVNRNTVAAAYKKLIQAGYGEPKGRGVQVAFAPTQDHQDTDVPEGLVDVGFSNPDPKLLPALKPVSRQLSFTHCLYGHPPDSPALLASFADWSRSSHIPRGEQMICPGTVETLERLLAIYTEPRDQVIVESPSYMKLTHVVRGLGLTPTGVALDNEGMVLQDLQNALNDQVRAIVLTPLAQNPTGVSYSKKRLKAISEILDRYPDLLVIEDEHMGMLSNTKYKTVCHPERKHWAVISSVAKYLGPDLRLAVLNGSCATVRRLKSRRATTGQWVSTILQDLVTALLQDDKLPSVISHARETYAQRRKTIVERLKARGVTVLAKDGFNLWIASDDEDRLAYELARRGWLARTGRDFSVGKQNGLRITFSALSVHQCTQLADAIADCLGRPPS